MKRIVMVILFFVPGAFGQGYIYRNMRWSTMLGCYIPRDCRWSTMLGAYVHRDYRWSPSAPSYVYPYYFPPYDCPPSIIVQPLKTSDCPKKRESKQLREPRENDGKWIIYNYLKNKGLDPDIADSFVLRNNTVSAIFLVRSKNLLIKYQNLREEKSLEGNSLWENYKKKWEEKSKEYETRGWKVGKILNK